MQHLMTARFAVLLVGISAGLALLAWPQPPNAGAGTRELANPAHESRIDAIFSSFGPSTPGCAVGVYRAGEIVFAKGYGMANLEHAIPITPETVLDIGSVSKQFTAFAIHLLASQGKVSLSDDVRKYVPELPDFGSVTTLQHLVNNTSGLRDYGALRMVEDPRWTVEHPLNRAEVMHLLQQQRALNFPSGDRYLYSNTNWLLLATVVERVEGRPFRDVLMQKVFGPLAMEHSVLRDDPGRIVPGRAATYTPLREGGYRANLGWALAHDLPGPGNVHTTLGDLARWDAAFYDEREGSTGIAQAMYAQARLADGVTIPYASGLIVGEHRGLRTIFHGGAGGGSSHLIRFPDQRLSVAVLCNQSSTHTPSHQYARRVADVFLPDDSAPVLPAAGPQDETQLSRYAGRYISRETGSFREFIVDDGRLAERSADQLWPLEALGEGRYADTDIRVEFTEDANAGTVFLTDGTRLPLRREHEEWRPKRDELAEYAGTYRSAELDVTWTIDVTPDALLLRRKYAKEQALQPLVADLFRAGPGLVMAFARNEEGMVARLSISFPGVLNLEFTRAAEP
jgi:CubicO group peptidase (beta-lactamase class C family)